MEEIDQDYLEKYLDVTKSQMFFAKGILFAEGISEAVLLPEMAKMLNRPFDKFAVEVVNIDGTSFRPFAKILTLPTGGKCFAKAAILTDDDRCTDKDDQDTYIAKDIDFDDDLNGIHEKIQRGNSSARFNNISELCSGINIELCGAKKTFEYELALQANNVTYILDAINSEFPQVGVKLKELVDAETMPEKKALLIWLFIRARNSYKGQFAQALCRTLQKQIEDIKNGTKIEKPFIVPAYIARAIYAVTEPEG
jgi:putative ATP-dependent endonuclease of OLD family